MGSSIKSLKRLHIFCLYAIDLTWGSLACNYKATTAAENICSESRQDIERPGQRLWEISNENHAEASVWQYDMIRTIKESESGQGMQHPVGMTPMWPALRDAHAPLFESPADWSSPASDAANPAYKDSPPAATGRKVLLSDTDHLWGIGGSPRWVWKSMLRGLNSLFMDPYMTAIRHNLPAWPSSDDVAVASISSPALEWEEIRKAMGYARAG
jgi:hypothetical protein